MNVFDLTAKISLDSSEYDQGLNDAESRANGIGSKIGKGLSTAAAIGGAAITAAATSVGVLVKKSVDGFAEQEQLLGGVQKLYGNMGLSVEDYAAKVGKSVGEVKGEWQKLEDAQNLVIEHANEAYKTAGMSASQYMETATSFSAALINSLGGDTVKAAEQTDVAMRAISDNFNTFGGDIENVKNAFQGFAKQNYTMLDNLKLGYGGTKTEMERLIADANEYAAANGEAANLTINSFSDIVTAIDLIQQKQNIAETTANEAATTVSGSLGMLKSAWDNLVTGFADPDADIGQLIDNVVESAETAFGNLLPVAEQALSGIAKFVSDGLPKVVEEIPKFFETMLPELVTTATNIVIQLAAELPSIASSIIETIPTILSQIMSAITDGASQFTDAGGSIVEAIGGGIMNALSGITDMGVQILEGLASGISENLPTLIDQGMNMLMELSSSIRENAGLLIDAGLDLIKSIAEGLIEGIPTFIETIPTIISNIAGIINDNAPKIIETGVEIIVKLAAGLIQAIPVLIENIPQILKAIFDAFMAFNWLKLGANIIKGIAEGILSLAGDLPTTLGKIAKNAIEVFKNFNWADAGTAVINFIIKGITSLINAIPETLTQIGNAAVTAFKAINWLDLGVNLVKGIASGIANGAKFVLDAVRSLGEKALSALKGVFKIHSPSRETEKDGVNFAKGLAKGIDATKGEVKKSAEDIASETLNAAKKRLENDKVYHEWSLAAEKAYWDAVRKQIKDGTQAKIDADKQYLEIAKELTAERNSLLEAKKTAKTQAKTLTVEYSKSMKQVQKKLKQDIKATRKALKQDLKKVDQQLAKDLQSLDDGLAKDIASVTSKLQKDLDKVNSALEKDLENVNKDLASTVKSLNDNLISEVDRLTKEYENSVKQRADTIKNFTGLFDAVSYDRAYSKDYLTKTLNEQVESLIDWDKELDYLESRVGRDNPVLKEIEEMGVSALYTLKELNKMSDTELHQYILLYNRKAQIAEARALQENETLKEQTENEIRALQESTAKQIESAEAEAEKMRQSLQYDAELERQQLRAEAETEMQELRAAAAQQRAELISEAEQQRQELQTAAEQQIKDMKKAAKKQSKELSKQYKSDLKALAKQNKQDGNSVGKAIIDGIKAGMQKESSSLNSVARKIAKQALNAMKSELKIKSPSRVFRDEVGENISLGIAAGIDDKAKAVRDSLKGVLDFNAGPLGLPEVRKGSQENIQNNSYKNDTVINVYGAKGQDENVLAKRIADIINTDVYRSQMALGMV